MPAPAERSSRRSWTGRRDTRRSCGRGWEIRRASSRSGHRPYGQLEPGSARRGRARAATLEVAVLEAPPERGGAEVAVVTAKATTTAGRAGGKGNVRVVGK